VVLMSLLIPGKPLIAQQTSTTLSTSFSCPNSFPRPRTPLMLPGLGQMPAVFQQLTRKKISTRVLAL